MYAPMSGECLDRECCLALVGFVCGGCDAGHSSAGAVAPCAEWSTPPPLAAFITSPIPPCAVLQPWEACCLTRTPPCPTQASRPCPPIHKPPCPAPSLPADVGGLLFDKDATYIDIPDWKVGARGGPCRVGWEWPHTSTAPLRKQRVRVWVVLLLLPQMHSSRRIRLGAMLAALYLSTAPQSAHQPTLLCTLCVHPSRSNLRRRAWAARRLAARARRWCGDCRPRAWQWTKSWRSHASRWDIRTAVGWVGGPGPSRLEWAGGGLSSLAVVEAFKQSHIQAGLRCGRVCAMPTGDASGAHEVEQC